METSYWDLAVKGQAPPSGEGTDPEKRRDWPAGADPVSPQSYQRWRSLMEGDRPGTEPEVYGPEVTTPMRALPQFEKEREKVEEAPLGRRPTPGGDPFTLYGEPRFREYEGEEYGLGTQETGPAPAGKAVGPSAIDIPLAPFVPATPLPPGPAIPGAGSPQYPAGPPGWFGAPESGGGGMGGAEGAAPVAGG